MNDAGPRWWQLQERKLLSMVDRRSPQEDAWASGAAYEPYVGRWSRPVAREFLNWLDVPASSRWLDVGCGTGALSQTILDSAAPSAVKGIDRSEDYVAFARERVRDESVQFEVGDAQALPVETGAYHAVVSGLVLNFIPEPGRAVAEMARAAKPGCVVAAYVWDYAGKMELMRHFWDVAAAIDPPLVISTRADAFRSANPSRCGRCSRVPASDTSMSGRSTLGLPSEISMITGHRFWVGRGRHRVTPSR